MNNRVPLWSIFLRYHDNGGLESIENRTWRVIITEGYLEWIRIGIRFNNIEFKLLWTTCSESLLQRVVHDPIGNIVDH